MTAKQFSKIQQTLHLTDVELAEQLDVERTIVWRWRTGTQKIDRRTELAMKYLANIMSISFLI